MQTNFVTADAMQVASHCCGYCAQTQNNIIAVRRQQADLGEWTMWVSMAWHEVLHFETEQLTERNNNQDHYCGDEARHKTDLLNPSNDDCYKNSPMNKKFH